MENVERRLKQLGFDAHPIQGVERIVIGAVGGKKISFPTGLETLPGVERVVPIMAPYKLVSRESRGSDSIIAVGGVSIGGPQLAIMAGPCAVESREQLLTVARQVKAAGAQILRGGAFKPRTSPYSFRGLEKEGLEILAEAREETGLLIVTEVLNPNEVELVAQYADIRLASEYAKLCFAPEGQSGGPAEARPGGHRGRVADGGGVYPAGEKLPGHSLRTGHPDL